MTNTSDRRVPRATHSGPRPGNYPLGSMESRAAARAMLAAQEPSFSEEEADAFVLYKGYFLLTARMSPDYHDVEQLEIYKLGKNVYEAIYGEIVPMHLNPAAQRGTTASFAFEMRFNREPEAGDVLHLSDVKARHREDVDGMRSFVDVWNRRVANLKCPFLVEENKLLCRMKPDRIGQGPRWEEDHRTAENDWWWIECDALGERAWGSSLPEGYRPTLSSVEFVGVVDGRHRCRAGSLLVEASE
jgi:hypothetical protein